MNVKTLIDKAANLVGTRYKLAKKLGVSPSQVYDWAEGRKPCSPADRARIAGFAGEDAVQELVRATLEATAGTTRGEQLKSALGKSLLQTGAGIRSVVVGLITSAFGMAVSFGSDIPRCIKRRSIFC